MTIFDEFAANVQEHIAEMIETGDLFVTDLDRDVLWQLYLDSFPNGTNPVFRERPVHDCSACRQFVKVFGNVVLIRDCKVTTIWDFPAEGDK